MDLTKDRKIQTVVELMGEVQNEIEAIKNGGMDAKVGSLVMRGRGLQLRAVELTLQAARLDQSMRSTLGRRIGSLPEAPKEEEAETKVQ